MGYFDYIFGLGVAFCIWDAINCGANDVANSFATSVNSKALTMTGAMIIATAMELLGAMTLGTYNASTIRGGIINVSAFADNGGVFMLGMLCVVISSSTFNFLSNRFGWATSSTHAMIGALIGVGVASNAGVTWGYVVTSNGGQVTGQNGLGSVIASFAISPLLAGILGFLIFTLVKVVVLQRQGVRSFYWALAVAPFWYALVGGFEAWLITWKSPRLPSSLQDNVSATVGIFFGAFIGVGLLTACFLMPYIYRRVWLGWNLHLWHLPLMCLPSAFLARTFKGIDTPIANFDDRHLRGEEIPEDEQWQWHPDDVRRLAKKRAALAAGATAAALTDAEGAKPAADASSVTSRDSVEAPPASPAASPTHVKHATSSSSLDHMVGAPDFMTTGPAELSYQKRRKAQFKADMTDKSLKVHQKMYKALVYVFFIGVDRDIADYEVDRPDIADLHARATLYYGKTEAVFRYLQILTSALGSFAHGANDVALSVGPLATLYYYWTHDGRGNVPKTSVVTDWQLAVGAMSLVTGLWLYGYNMMRVLGNRLTYHSPTRGFAMELAAAITVLIAARNGIPVSTTNCIVGATMGVGLANGDWKGVNWKLFLFTICTWLYTVPLCALMSGCLFAVVAYSPKMGCDPVRMNTFGQSIMINGQNITGANLKFYPQQC